MTFALADETLAKQKGVSVQDIVAWRKENNLTWHECNDTKTMQAIPSKINSVFGHLGGVGEINAAAR